MKKRHLIAAGIIVAVVAVVGSLWMNEGPLWQWVMLESHRYEKTLPSGYRIRGLTLVNRWTKEPIGEVSYFVGNGIKHSVSRVDNGKVTEQTFWNHDGTVLSQHRNFDENGVLIPGSELRTSPPWLWGVTDQTEPTAPWWGKE